MSNPGSRRDFLKYTGAYAALALQLSAGHDGSDATSPSSAPTSEALTLVQHSRSSYAIVIDPDAAPAIQHGATELQTHLYAMSYARLPIISSTDVAAHHLPPGVIPGHVITIGTVASDPAFGTEAFRLRTHDAALEIVGGSPRGALYGCYAFLEDILGVRWFTPRITHIPSRATVVVKPLDVHEAPAFAYRLPTWHELLVDPNFTSRRRVNGADLDVHLGGGVRYGAPYGFEVKGGGDGI